MLADDIKLQLGYRWTDEQTDRLIGLLIQEGQAFLERYKPNIDYESDHFARSLLADYVRYAMASARDDFKKNYFEEILSLSDEGSLNDQTD
jgi:hypothetical protein